MNERQVNLAELRRRAEQALAETESKFGQSSADWQNTDMQHLVEELRVYQTELEIQNQELQQSQSKLIEALDKYQALFDFLPLPAVLVDERGIIIESNREAMAFLGLRSISLQYRYTLSQFVEAPQRFHLQSALHNIERQEPVFLSLIKIRTGSGETIPCDMHLLHLSEETRPVSHALVVLVDKRLEMELHDHSTELEATKQQLQDQNRRLNAVLEGTRVGTWEWNVQTGETDFNERWAQLIGYTLDELAPISIATWRKLTHPDDLAHCEELLKKHLAGELPHYECEMRMRHKAGHWVWILDRGKISSWSEDDAPLIVSGTHQDISERKRIEQELYDHRNHLEQLVAARTADLEVAKEAAEAANRAKTAFLSMTSHELRTPMNGVMGMITLAKAKITDPKPLDYLSKAERACRQLLGIINDVLDISRIESSRLTLAAVDFNLRDVRNNVMGSMESIAKEKGLALLYQPDDALEAKPFIGDPTRLTQVLVNLVGNAVKFTQAGQITVLVQETHCRNEGAARLRFEVRDTGVGIDPQNQSRIFQTFEQADNSMTRKYGGTGLGLALCKKLVEAMGGSIGLQSQLHQGSLFWFEVEVKKAPTSELVIPDSQSAKDELMRRHLGAFVLVAEDDAFNQEIARLMLEEADLNVFIASDGQQAVERAKSSDFDLILMDLNMPNLDGIEATKAIRQIPLHADTPIIAMTANAFAEDREACLQAGMNDHIGKPVLPEILYETILHWLDWKTRPKHSD
ncbi:MAG: hypothetical protein Kow0065_22980 [Methylomicrobium sp.]